MRFRYTIADGDFLTWLKSLGANTVAGNTTMIEVLKPGPGLQPGWNLLLHETTAPSASLGDNGNPTIYAWLGIAEKGDTLVQDANLGHPVLNTPFVQFVRLYQPDTGGRAAYLLLPEDGTDGVVGYWLVATTDTPPYIRLYGSGYIFTHAAPFDAYGAFYPGSLLTQCHPSAIIDVVGQFGSMTVPGGLLPGAQFPGYSQTSAYLRGLYSAVPNLTATWPNGETGNGDGFMAIPYVYRHRTAPNPGHAPLHVSMAGIFLGPASLDNITLPDGSLLMAAGTAPHYLGSFLTTIQ